MFFFSSRRRHTRFKCDWSSDVCSSDLRSLKRTAGARRTVSPLPVAASPSPISRWTRERRRAAIPGPGARSAAARSATSVAWGSLSFLGCDGSPDRPAEQTLMRGHKVEQLGIATVGFFWCFLMWFSTAAFSPSIAATYHLTIKDLGLLASSAIWMAPLGRIVAGWASDRFGAPRTFAAILAGCGLVSIASAFTTSYELLFAERVVVAIAGVSFVVGVQHVAQWFDAHEIGTAEGLYAGTGVAGIQIAAGTFAAVVSFNASLFRPFAGFMSDLFQRKGWTPLPFIAKELPYAPRLHWLGIALILIMLSMIGLTVAGLYGFLPLSIAVLVALGIFVSFGTGGTFALVPLLFPDRPGVAAGFIGGVSTLRGLAPPPVFVPRTAPPW